MSVLTKDYILRRLKVKTANALVVTPLLNLDQIGDSSIDVRLGCEFVVLEKGRVSGLKLIGVGETASKVDRYCTKYRIAYGSYFVLHPGQLVLGTTLEYVRMPDDVMAYVVGKSSWGRMGLIVATATSVAPGFKGVIALEIVNMGDIPMEVSPGFTIAQLVFEECIGTAEYSGRYACQTGPETRLMTKGNDWDIWNEIHKNPLPVNNRFT